MTRREPEDPLYPAGTGAVDSFRMIAGSAPGRFVRLCITVRGKLIT